MAAVIIDNKWFGEQVKQLAKQLVGKSAFEIGLVVEAQAKELAPVDGGYLAGSIMTSGQDGRATSSEEAPPIDKPDKFGEVFVGSSLEYATYVEYGTGKFVAGGRKTPWSYQDLKGVWHTTSGMPAQPYLRPALEMARGRAPEIVVIEGKAVFKDYLK